MVLSGWSLVVPDAGKTYTEHTEYDDRVKDEARERKMPETVLSYAVLSAYADDADWAEFRLGIYRVRLKKEELPGFIPFIRMVSTDCSAATHTYMYLLGGQEHRFDQDAEISNLD